MATNNKSKVTKKKPTPLPPPSVYERLRAWLFSYRAVVILIAIGFVSGFLWLAGIRFLLVRSPEVHYHANYAVYLNGEREDFSEFTYYEEVAACSSEYTGSPKGRVHMHDSVSDVIHVHDSRVTYGDFFQNIGWGIGDEYLATLDQVYQTDNDNKLTYILNGETVDNIANRVIGSLDRLLVSYGPENTDYAKQFASVASTAEERNSSPDPSSCGGLSGAGYESVLNRLKHATFWD